MLVVDTSGSMGESGMTTVRSAVAAFLSDAPADVAVGLVSFAATAGVDVPPTTDRARVQKAVNALRSRGETTLYDGVLAAASGLSGYEDRSLVLLSDGGDTRSTKATRASATAELKRRAIRAEVIGFKTQDSDNGVLKGFAAAGGGSVAAAGNEAAVRGAFQAAAKVLDAQVAFSFAPDTNLRSTQTVLLRGLAGGQPFTAQSRVDFGAAPLPVTSSPGQTANVASDGEGDLDASSVAAQSGLSTGLLLALVATFLGVLGIGLGVAWPMLVTSRRRRVEGIEAYVRREAVGTETRFEAPTPTAISESLVSFGDRVMDGRESTGKTMALIERADLPLRAGEWWVLRILSVAVAMVVSLLFLHKGPVGTAFGALVGLAVGLLLPAIVLRFLAKRRSRKFEGQLPDLLMLASSSLSTGFSLPQALDAVAKDASDPAGKEFSRVLAETRIGVDVADSLETMADRMDSDNMRWTAMAIRIQREVGGNLAETLRTTAGTLREREELRRHVRGLSAEGRLSAYILIALPIGLFFYMMKVNYEYVSLLWTNPIGWGMSTAGLIGMGIGVVWMRKVVEVEV
jgi:tight adherence protein B